MLVYYSTKSVERFWEAICYGEIDEVKYLLNTESINPNDRLFWSKGWRSKYKWRDRHPPLHTACERGYLEIAKVLVQAGAKIGKVTFFLMDCCLIIKAEPV